MNNNGIEPQLLAITREFLLELEAERALQAITLDAALERELGIDSLGKIELLHRIEKTFSIRLPEKAMIEAESLRQIAKIIEQEIPDLPQKLQAGHFSPVLESISLDLTTVTTLPEIIREYAAKQPQRPHIYLQDELGKEQIIHYGQLFEEATRVAKGLAKRGIRPGESIAIMLPTSDEFFYTFCGVLLAGAIPVPVYPPFRPDRIEEYAKREARILQNAEARILVTFSEAEMLGKILRNFIPALKEVTTVKSLQTSAGSLINPVISTNDISLIQYTSGSTGDPKGVTLTHANMLANIRAIGKCIPVKPTDIAVSWLPLYHDMGLMTWLCSLYFGIPVTILSPITFLTRPERWLWNIHYHQATLSGGPNFAYELCVKKINPEDIEGLDLSSWQFAFNGAEAIKPDTLERFAKKFAPYGFRMDTFAPVYGLAEATVGLLLPTAKRLPRIDRIERETFSKENRAIPSESSRDILEFVGCGEPIIGHDARVVNDKGVEVAERVAGNLEFRGPSAMQGYYNNPVATQKAFHDGWWATGDLCYRDGREIFITGRKKDLIIKAGRNLYPEEVEEIVGQVPGVRNGCIVAFGISDPDSGTEKLVVLAETYESDDERQQAMRQQIIESMVSALGMPPDAVILAPPRTILKTSSGKLQRSACKQAYLDGKLTKRPLSTKFQIVRLAWISLYKKLYRWLTFPGKFLYSLYIGLLLLLTLPPLWLIILPLPQSAVARLSRFCARLFYRLIGCPVTVEGIEHLPEKGPVIYVANHASYADPAILLGILPAGIGFVAKKEALKIPIISTFIRKLGIVTVDRMDFSKSIENTNKIASAIRAGQSMVIFPEGTFTYATGLRPFKLGAFRIAAETGTPIYPIAISGARAMLRGDTLLAKPGRVKLTISPPIQPTGNDWKEIVRLHAAARADIAKHCGEPVIDVITAGPVMG